MRTDEEAAKLRRELKQGDRGRGKRFDAELRRRVVRFAEQRRREGASWMTIATELGACFETIRRWCVRGTAGEALHLRRVELIAEPEGATPSNRTLTVVSPNGLRIEGAGID